MGLELLPGGGPNAIGSVVVGEEEFGPGPNGMELFCPLAVFEEPSKGLLLFGCVTVGPSPLPDSSSSSAAKSSALGIYYQTKK